MPTKPAQLDKPRYTGSLTFPDHYPVERIDRGVITLIGSPNKAKVTVWSFDEVGPGDKGKRVDIFKDVLIEQDDNGDLVFTGTSFMAFKEHHSPNGSIRFSLKLNGKCADCGYS